MGVDASGINHAETTVTTAGTAVAIGSGGVKARNITVRALSGNTGDIYLGSSTVSSTDGFPLSPGEVITVPAGDLNDYYIDAETSGDKIRYIAINF